MRRYTITLGAATTAGGRVISASSDGTIDGARIALQGDLVACPACGCTGKIVCVGPRIPETLNGKNVALDNDLCNCRCTPLPRLMTRQSLRCQVIRDSGHALSLCHDSALRERPRALAGAAFADRFVLIDDEHGTPLAEREYAVVRANGKLEFGVASAHGHTHLLSPTGVAERVEIYAQGAARAATLISPSGAVLHHRARYYTTPLGEAGLKEVRVKGALSKARREERAASGAGKTQQRGAVRVIDDA
ncbi:MAG: PAAR domain-containing protein [Pseudomonadota bacterium]